MKNIFWVLLMGIAFFSCKTGQKAASATASPEVENSLLWEIKGKNLTKPSYLFGTIHMIDKKDFVLSAKTRASLEKTQRVAFEINMEEMMDISNLMPLMMKSFMNGDTTLQDLLTVSEYAKVEAHFQKIGLPLSFLERMKPMFLTIMASEDMTSVGKKEDQMVSYELELMNIAQERSMAVAGLETAEYQMSMFDSIPYKIQAKMLVDAIEAGDNTEEVKEFDQMVALYKAQDIGAMVSLVSDDAEGIGRYENLLLNNRNKNWIPVMSEMMKEEPTFFAVGAGHLGGQLGVVTLLRKAGYELTPLYQ